MGAKGDAHYRGNAVLVAPFFWPFLLAFFFTFLRRKRGGLLCVSLFFFFFLRGAKTYACVQLRWDLLDENSCDGEFAYLPIQQRRALGIN
jgi:hypothetical protein